VWEERLGGGAKISEKVGTYSQGGGGGEMSDNVSCSCLPTIQHEESCYLWKRIATKPGKSLACGCFVCKKHEEGWTWCPCCDGLRRETIALKAYIKHIEDCSDCEDRWPCTKAKSLRKIWEGE